MVKKINLSFGYIVSFILIIMGIVYLAITLNQANKIKAAHNINSFSLSMCEEGDYISGYIDDYLVYSPTTPFGTYPVGTQTAVGVGVSFFNIYALETIDNKYMQVLVTENDSEILSAFLDEDVEVEPIYYEGKVVKAGYEPNYEWLKAALNKETNEEVDSVVSPNLYIIPTVFSKNTDHILGSIFCIVFGCLFFYLSGSFKGLVNYKKKELLLPQMGDTYIPPSKYADKVIGEAAYLLKSEKRKLETLLTRIEDVTKKGYRGVLSVAVGLVIMVFFGNFMGGMIIKLIGLTLFVIGLKNSWTAFINSEMKFAYFISNLFNIDTLYKQKLSHLSQINRLNNLVKRDA